VFGLVLHARGSISEQQIQIPAYMELPIWYRRDGKIKWNTEYIQWGSELWRRIEWKKGIRGNCGREEGVG